MHPNNAAPTIATTCTATASAEPHQPPAPPSLQPHPCRAQHVRRLSQPPPPMERIAMRALAHVQVHTRSRALPSPPDPRRPRRSFR
eukprot:5275724-Pleurochrysis_carterae.AAC.1